MGAWLSLALTTEVSQLRNSTPPRERRFLLVCYFPGGGEARAIAFSNIIPMRANACAGWAANWRHAAAMLVCPAHLSRPIAVLRSAAMT